MRLKTPFTLSFSFLFVASASSLYACGSPSTPGPGAAGSGNAASGGSAGKMNGSGGTGPGGMTSTGGSGANAGATTTGGAGGTTGGTGGTGAGGGAGHGGSTATGGSAGVGTGGAAGTTAMGGTTSTGGAPFGGMSAGGGAGAGAGGTAGAAQGGAAGGGGSAGTSTGGWKCPAGVTGTPTLGAPTRIASVPPKDDFNQNNGTFGNVEGPVWIGDALYVSEMSSQAYGSDGNVKKSRILKVTSDGTASIFIADSGSNGLATDADGNIVAAVHKDGSITRFTLPGGTPTPIVTMYNGKRFDSPNDLAIHSNGTIYFSDPSFQAPNTPPQPQTLAYRIAPGASTATPIPSAASPDMLSNPNGVTLSLAEDYLYISADTGKRYPVMADGTLGAGANFTATNGGDGMTIDCAGNLYVAKANTATVVVYKPDGSMIGTITVPEVQAATNVAFGGSDHQTLYITGLGNSKGLFKLSMNLPGRPY